MAWKYNGKTIKIGRGWVDSNGIQHPRNWNIWSESDKTAAGLVWEDDPVETPFDSRFYWSANDPKNLNDVAEVDYETSVTITDEFNNVLYNYGLKTKYKNEINETANFKLQPTDWMIIANNERNRSIPTSVTNYRAAVVSCATVIKTKINACTSIGEFTDLFEAPTTTTTVDGVITTVNDGNAPISVWPNIKAY